MRTYDEYFRRVFQYPMLKHKRAIIKDVVSQGVEFAVELPAKLLAARLAASFRHVYGGRPKTDIFVRAENVSIDLTTMAFRLSEPLTFSQKTRSTCETKR